MSSLFLCLLSRILLYGFTTICLSIDVHFSCLQFLATIHAVNRNIHVQVFVWICILISLEQVFRVIVCVCVCIYIHTQKCIYIYIHTHIYICVSHTFIYIYFLYLYIFLIREACHFCPFLTPSYIPPYSQREKFQIFSNGVSVSFKLLEVY